MNAIDRHLRILCPDPDERRCAINLKTAKELGLTVPLILQQRADEVIE